MGLEWMVLPALGSFIGWITNRVAIRLLFRPHRPLRILGFEIQGLLPRRREDLARSVGRVLEDEILTPDSLAERLSDPRVRASIAMRLSSAAREVMSQRAGYLPGIVSGPLVDYAAAAVEKEADSFLAHRAGELAADLADELDVASMVRSQLDSLSLGDLESLVLKLAGRELRHIEILGGILGFIIGLAQAGLLTFIR